MALGSRLWRPVPVDCWEWLEDLSPLAQRTWFWLWTGPTSTPHGVVSVRPYHAAGALKTKPSALLVALSELEQAGRIVMQQGSPSRIDLYLVGYLPAQCPVRPVQRRGIKKGIERVDLGLPTSQALEEWAIWDAACSKADDRLESGWTEPEPQQKQKQKQENKQEKMVSTEAPAVAVDKPKRAKTLAQDPPDLQATVDYFLEQGSTEGEAHKCHDYWLSAGWRRKSGPIKDWLATCRTWIGNSAQFAAPGRNTGKGLPSPRTVVPTDPDDIPDDDGFTPRQRREAEIQIAKMRKENDEYDAAQSAKRSQTGLFGSQR
jgi:hypothetical protein